MAQIHTWSVSHVKLPASKAASAELARSFQGEQRQMIIDGLRDAHKPVLVTEQRHGRAKDLLGTAKRGNLGITVSNHGTELSSEIRLSALNGKIEVIHPDRTTGQLDGVAVSVRDLLKGAIVRTISPKGEIEYHLVNSTFKTM